MHVLIAGCGWLGTSVGLKLLERGDRVTGIRRDPFRAAALAKLGIEPLALDLARPFAAEQLPAGIQAIIACQSASAEGPEAYRAAYVAANQHLLEAARTLEVPRLVYTGSTGVFGQVDGSTVDERTPPQPASPTAQVLVEAEERVLQSREVAGRVVRLSGLYGPGRAGIIERVRSGVLALGSGDQAWMNFCHLDDAVACVLAALDRGRAGAIYHGTDAQPARRQEVVEWISQALGIPPPRREGPDPASARANRRIVGERTRAELKLELAYPSFREGLRPLLRAGGLH